MNIGEVVRELQVEPLLDQMVMPAAPFEPDYRAVLDVTAGANHIHAAGSSLASSASNSRGKEPR